MSNALHFVANHRPFQPTPRSTERPRPAAWVWPAVVALSCGPFVLTAIGLSIAALRPTPRPAAEMVAVPAIVPTVAPEPESDSVEEAAPRPVIIAITESVASLGKEPTQLIIAPPEPVKAAPSKPSRCDRFGTAIDFVRSPTLAFDRAARDQTLVMVLHLAGYFDDPGFT